MPHNPIRDHTDDDGMDRVVPPERSPERRSAIHREPHREPRIRVGAAVDGVNDPRGVASVVDTDAREDEFKYGRRGRLGLGKSERKESSEQEGHCDEGADEHEEDAEDGTPSRPRVRFIGRGGHRYRASPRGVGQHAIGPRRNEPRIQTAYLPASLPLRPPG